jgi:hypothetical protein
LYFQFKHYGTQRKKIGNICRFIVTILRIYPIFFSLSLFSFIVRETVDLQMEKDKSSLLRIREVVSSDRSPSSHSLSHPFIPSIYSSFSLFVFRVLMMKGSAQHPNVKGCLSVLLFNNAAEGNCSRRIMLILNNQIIVSYFIDF